MVLSTHVKLAPFAAKLRRGYLRDYTERDLAVHLETALRGVILADRWPKSGIDVIVTVLEGEEDCWWGRDAGLSSIGSVGDGASGMMSILSGCITVASAAIVDAGIDCIDLVTGGVAALVRKQQSNDGQDKEAEIVLDPSPSEHQDIVATCVVGYLKSFDELTLVWMKGAATVSGDQGKSGVSPLIDGAVQAAASAQKVLVESINEAIQP